MLQELKKSLRDPLILDILSCSDLSPRTLRDKNKLRQFLIDFFWPIGHTFILLADWKDLSTANQNKDHRGVEVAIRKCRSSYLHFNIIFIII